MNFNIYQVRSAQIRDAQKIAGLYASSFPEHIMVHRGILTKSMYFEERIGNPDEHWVVEEIDGVIRAVGALAVCRSVGLGEIERVCVDKEHRGNGIAYELCRHLTEKAKTENLGFIEAFARGDEHAMQRTFEKLGFKVFGIAPRFEVIHDGKIVREQFVHMGLELKPETIDEEKMNLILSAQELLNKIRKK
jgi:ribosomal protein S18 acetylase RimI-like enzyme